MSSLNQEFNIEQLLAKLLHKNWRDKEIDEKEIRAVCLRSREIFLEQPILLQLKAPVKICGDIHGQYTDLLKVFQIGGNPRFTNYLFVGDYVDRGKNSIECMLLLLCYKIKYPLNFFLLRGNHESSQINRIYGFYDQCKRRINVKTWRYFVDVFNVMPVTAIIDGKIICMHGGLSPQLRSFKDILAIKRPAEIPDYGLLCDLLWSDPDPSIRGWAKNERGTSYIFGDDVIQTFLKKHDLDLICRAHQVKEDGYEFCCKRKLVTIFTATNYCGLFNNNGVIMNVDENLVCSFQILRPGKKSKYE